MDQGRQVCRELDADVVPQLHGQPGGASTTRAGVQPGDPPLAVGAAAVDEALVVDHLTGEADKIGGKVVRHSEYVTIQMADVAVPPELFAAILDRIQQFGVPPPLVQRD